MKTATCKRLDGSEFTVEYDETALCMICGEPVIAASVGGTSICPWCDMGRCRYCGKDLPSGRTSQQATENIKAHMLWHKGDMGARDSQPPKGRPMGRRS